MRTRRRVPTDADCPVEGVTHLRWRKIGKPVGRLSTDWETDSSLLLLLSTATEIAAGGATVVGVGPHGWFSQYHILKALGYRRQVHIIGSHGVP